MDKNGLRSAVVVLAVAVVITIVFLTATRINVDRLEERVEAAHVRLSMLEAVEGNGFEPVGLLPHNQVFGLSRMLPAAVPFATSYRQIDNDTLAASTTLPNVPAGANVAWVIAEGQPLRWRNDGTTPTAADGMPIGVGSVLTYDLNEGPLQVVRQADGATAHVWYGRGAI